MKQTESVILGMADDIEDDFGSFEFGDGAYGSEAASVEIKDTGKRKRNGEDYEDEEEEDGGEGGETKKKKRKKNKAGKISKYIRDRNESQSVRNGSLVDQASFLQLMVQEGPHHSLQLKGESPLDRSRLFLTHSWSEDHFAPLTGVDRLPEDALAVLTRANEELELGLGTETEPKSPTVIILASSAVGCLPFVTSIKGEKGAAPKGKGKPIEGRWTVVKLFGKHMKASEQADLLKKPCSIGVGTPARIQQLVRAFSITFDLDHL